MWCVHTRLFNATISKMLCRALSQNALLDAPTTSRWHFVKYFLDITHTYLSHFYGSILWFSGRGVSYWAFNEMSPRGDFKGIFMKWAPKSVHQVVTFAKHPPPRYDFRRELYFRSMTAPTIYFPVVFNIVYLIALTLVLCYLFLYPL